MTPVYATLVCSREMRCEPDQTFSAFALREMHCAVMNTRLRFNDELPVCQAYRPLPKRYPPQAPL